jgi:hypothetical protein
MTLLKNVIVTILCLDIVRERLTTRACRALQDSIDLTTFRHWRCVTDLSVAIMDDERDTDSARVTSPMRDVLGLEFSRFLERILFVGRRQHIFYRCCYLGRSSDKEGIQCKWEMRYDSPKLVARQGKHKHESALEACATSERHFASKLGHCHHTTWILCATFCCIRRVSRVQLITVIDKSIMVSGMANRRRFSPSKRIYSPSYLFQNSGRKSCGVTRI